MQHLLKTSIPFAVVLILSSCAGNGSSENKTETTASHDHDAMEQTVGTTSATPVLKNDKLNAVYQHYIHLTTALTNSDMAEAKIAANAIEAGAKDVDGATALAASAAKVTTASDIEAQRAAFATMSKDMTSLIKKEGLSAGELYIAHCPMAFNDKGASWISGSKEIRNPYFGEKMLTCGEMQETIQ
jgi:hypothetical protein